MKLSEAIRLGAMLKPQANGGYAGEGSCALLAAADALGIATVFDVRAGRYLVDYVVLERRYPFLLDIVDSPVHTFLRARAPIMRDVIWHLNDSCGWTREQIADWVETIERAQDAEAVGAVSVAVES